MSMVRNAFCIGVVVALVAGRRRAGGVRMDASYCTTAGAGVSGQCEELQAELGCRPRVTVQNMRDSGRIRWLIDG
jgi:hypothetical protein